MRRGRGRKSRFGDDGFEAWGGYMAAKKSKLQDQFTEAAGKEECEKSSNIFQGISIFVNGYTIPSADELKQIMLSNGGTYHHYYSTDITTFIIATNLADAKIKKLRGQPKIVKPNWITECLSAGKLLDHRPFLLYSNYSKSQPKITFSTIKSFKEEDETDSKNDAISSFSTDSSPQNSSLSISGSKIYSSDVLVERPSSPDPFDFDDLNSEELNDEEKSEECAEVINDPLPSTSKSSSFLETAKSSHIESTSKTNTGQPQRMLRAGESNFLSEFYNHSRLHHISTMGAMFKKYVSDLRKNHDGKFPGLDELLAWKKQENLDDTLLPDGQKIYMHIDMDCFFVSVGLRNRPELKGYPVAVTHAKGNPQPSRQGSNRAAEIECYRQRMENKTKSNVVLKDWMSDDSDNSSMAEIASCSYEARKVGLKNGMFLGTAFKKCPNLKTIPYDFEGYKEVSFILYNSVASFTLNIEAVSCDEMFVDCTEILSKTKSTPMQFATFLRNKIKNLTGCPASTGFGGNILLSRLATKKAKPDGQFYLSSEDVEQFMYQIKIEDLPGVGRNLAMRLHSQDISTCGDLQRLSLNHLKTEFGHKTGQSLHSHCRGQDGRSLDLDHQRKSVSAEVNYGIRFVKPEEVVAFVRELAEEVRTRLLELNSRGRCVTLKLMVKAKNAPVETAKFMGHGVCDSISRSATLATETNDTAVIAREIMALLGQLPVQPCDLRGMGIQVSKLTMCGKTERNLNEFIVRGAKVVERSEPGPSHRRDDEVSLSNRPKLAPELDPDFLAALPEDIRAEVIEEHKQRLQQETSETLRSSPQPQTLLSTLTFSQIDPNFLDALPADVKQDLIEDLRRQQNPIPQVVKSPSKLPGPQSPSKLTKNGSPKKVRKYKKRTLPKGQQKINIILTSPVKKEENASVLVETPEINVVEQEEEEEEVESFGILTARTPVRDLLCLIREWVEKESHSEPVDQQIIIDFLQHLVNSRKIDKVDAMLRTLHRSVEKTSSEDWKLSYHEIVAQVQTVMLQVYGYKLKVALHFERTT